MSESEQKALSKFIKALAYLGVVLFFTLAALCFVGLILVLARSQYTFPYMEFFGFVFKPLALLMLGTIGAVLLYVRISRARERNSN